MCIVCRSAKGNDIHRCVKIADDVINDHHHALDAMKKAAHSMLEASKLFEPGYDRTHKRMVKIIRMWAQIEHQRESDADKEEQKP